MREVDSETPVEGDITEFSEQSKVLMRKLRRSIRSSIATSRRLADWDPHDLGGRVAEFGETLEWRNEEIGWDLGVLRRKAKGTLESALREFNEPFLTHANAMLTIAEHVNTQSATTWRQTAHAQAKLDVICELHSQAIIVTEEVLALLAAGLPSGASARWRTLYELSIIGSFIARSPKDTANRYASSHLIELWKQNELSLSELSRKDSQVRKALLDRREQLLPIRNALLEKYGSEIDRSYGWAASRLRLKRVTFNDIERRVRAQGFRMLPHGDRYSYKEASQHIHGERLSSMRTLVKVPNTTAHFVGATLEPSLIQVATVWTLQHLTWTLAELTSRTQGIPEALYWGYVAHMYSLDADTETWHGIHAVNTGYLRNSFAVANDDERRRAAPVLPQ